MLKSKASHRVGDGIWIFVLPHSCSLSLHIYVFPIHELYLEYVRSSYQPTSKRLLNREVKDMNRQFTKEDIKIANEK